MSSSWYDIIASAEDNLDTRRIRMTPTEWRQEVKIILRSWRGDLRNAINYLNHIESLRAAAPVDAQPPSQAPRPRTEFEVNFAMWRDMAEEPEKYGDDITEWLDLDAQLMAGPGRWRLGAFWATREVPVEETAATKVQALFRGHLARTRATFRDCSMCLAHRISPLQTDVGMICRDCGAQGPYEDTTGPLADPWSEFRADFVDLAEIVELPQCRWCFAPMDEGQSDFCDDDCKHSFVKETWRGYRD